MRFRRFLTRRQFLTATAAGVAATGIYTWGIEPHWLQIVRRELPIRHLPESLVGATLAQFSDLHVGPRVDDSYVISVFDRIRDLKPHIVLYTGDWISFETNIGKRAERVLSKLVQGSLGTFGILGNHDYGIGFQDFQCANMVASIAKDAGAQILRNQSVDVHGLVIAGLDDLWAGRFDPKQVLPELSPEIPSLVMVHNPDAVDRNGWDRYSGWILAGHTHGGQCKPPFLPPPLLPVQNRRYTCGEFELSGQRRLYISRGVGHLMRVRFNVRPEVTLFTLTRPKESA